jgi:hypothetical protein
MVRLDLDENGELLLATENAIPSLGAKLLEARHREHYLKAERSMSRKSRGDFAVKFRFLFAVIACGLCFGGAKSAEPCSALPVSGGTYNTDTGEFNVRRATTHGDLLICGQFGDNGTDVTLHFLDGTEIWTLDVPPVSSDGPAHVTFTYGGYGAMTYDWIIGTGERTVAS